MSLMSSKIHEFEHALFSFKSHSASSLLFLAHGLMFEVRLFMFTDQHLPLFPYPSFASLLLYFISFLSLFGMLSEPLSLHLGIH